MQQPGADGAARTTGEPGASGGTCAGGPGATALVARAPKAEGGEVAILGQGRALIESLAAAGFTDTTIAARLRISASTLRECRKRDPLVAEALARGRARLEDELVHGLMRQAREGYAPAAMFLLKTRCGYRETGSPDGGDTKIAVQIVLPGAMSMADYERMVDASPALALPQPVAKE